MIKINSKVSSAILLAFLVSALSLQSSNAFIVTQTNINANINNANANKLVIHAHPNDELYEENVNRRSFFRNTVSSTLFTIMASSSTFPAMAVPAESKAPTQDELNRIKVGYEQIDYLLNNFDKETTVCRENGGECKRDADSVRRYLGLRSTQDPLFQIEKVFAKVKYMDVDPDKLETFFEATEDWNTAVNMSNSMAFISQFGEYNPGGGKDEVLKYLEESKKQVILAKKALGDIMEALDLK